MNRSYTIAVILALGIVAWVGGGYLFKSPEMETSKAPPAPASTQPVAVAVRTQDATPIEQHILAQGQAEPNRAVTVRAETSGQIAEILADEGAAVAAGDVIARLKVKDREARLERAKARVREQERAHKASQALGKKGYQTQRQSDETYSALQTAKAELEEARIELEHTEIRAPFEGVIVTSAVEIGTYVGVNGEVAAIVDNDPLVVRVNIAQQDISKIQAGRPASVAFATGAQREGKIRYVAPRADENTRTFRVEIEAPNPRGDIPSGISAETRIPTGSAVAHFVSPATLSLNDEGVLGVKAVDETNKVIFHAARIVRSDTDGIWIAGLPDHARIITVGQGFVRVGEEVRVAEEKSGSKPDSEPRAAAFLSAADRRIERARQ